MNFELRGDELEIIKDIKQYVPLLDREDIWSWLCYFENCVKESKKKYCNCGYPLPPKIREFHEGLMIKEVNRVEEYRCPKCKEIIRY